jgi:hypothetical protein
MKTYVQSHSHRVTRHSSRHAREAVSITRRATLISVLTDFVLRTLEQVPEPPEEKTRQHHRRRQRKHHAMAKLRTVAHCRPEWFAAMVPAIPDEQHVRGTHRQSEPVSGADRMALNAPHLYFNRPPA